MRGARLAAICSPAGSPWDSWFQFVSVIQRDISWMPESVFLLKSTSSVRMAELAPVTLVCVNAWLFLVLANLIPELFQAELSYLRWRMMSKSKSVLNVSYEGPHTDHVNWRNLSGWGL